MGFSKLFFVFKKFNQNECDPTVRDDCATEERCYADTLTARLGCMAVWLNDTTQSTNPEMVIREI